MSTEDLPPSHEEIMWATHDALVEHGFADLTFRKIASNCSKSHSLLTYHYDTKKNLITEYLYFIREHLKGTIEDSESDDPLERLFTYLDYFTVSSGEYDEDLEIAFLEFELLAYRDEDFRQVVREHNVENFEFLANIIRDGIDEGVFRSDTDSDTIAKLLITTLIGASEREITSDIDGLTAQVRQYIDTEILPSLLLTDSQKHVQSSCRER